MDRDRSCATKLFGSRHDVIFLAGHFSANSALAADFATSVAHDRARRVDRRPHQRASSSAPAATPATTSSTATPSPGVTQPLDWAQAFAQQAGDAHRRHRLPVRRHRLPRVQRAALPRLRPRAAGRHGPRCRSARRWSGAKLDYLADDARPPGHPREGAARGDALRPADARRRTCPPAAAPTPRHGRRDHPGRRRPPAPAADLGLATDDLTVAVDA